MSRSDPAQPSPEVTALGEPSVREGSGVDWEPREHTDVHTGAPSDGEGSDLSAALAEGRKAPPWQRWEVAAYGGLLLVVLVMHLWDLGSRALHHDESLHAVYSWYLYQGRGYEHLPLMHGPFQFHGTALLYWLFGDSNFTARLLPALFGTALVAMPLLLRYRLGTVATLVTAMLLAFSPVMLYFGRFARNDIYMAVWALALVAFMWRYLDTGRVRYLYLTALFLALAFATKETTYILVAVLGGYLFILAIGDIVGWLLGRVKLAHISRPGVLLLLLVTLSLPMWSAGFSLFQGFLGENLVLANDDRAAGAYGIPMGDGEYVAVGIVLVLLAISILVGLAWRPRVWLLCAAIYYGVWVLLFTTFFTNLMGEGTDIWRRLATGGIGSGVWQSMGYWIAQQGVARGSQPWYYYFVIGSVYETLPFLFATVGAVFYLRRGDAFTRFLVFWAVITLLLYTYASEKMPWLLMSIALPLIMLSGRFLGDLMTRLNWRRTLSQGGLFALLGVPLLLLLLGALLVVEPGAGLKFWGVGLALLGGIGVLLALGFRLGVQPVLALSALGLAGVLFLLGVRTGIVAAYFNGDVPVEMLVYTQSSPDIPRIAGEIRQQAQESGDGDSLRITVDGTDGYAWPWAWYLRDYNAGYPCYSGDAGCSQPEQAPNVSVLLLNARNQGALRGVLGDFCGGERYKHRWWFPEVYRNATPGKLWDGLLDREQRQKVLRYLLYRELDSEQEAVERLGSVDAYFYVDCGLAGAGHALHPHFADVGLG